MTHGAGLVVCDVVSLCDKPMYGPLGTCTAICSLPRGHKGACKDWRGESEQTWLNRLNGATRNLEQDK